ncbi:hypothetical protein CXR29_12155 [Brevibacterium linens]|nr:hypothetical protein CXR29_12155 [Brevibacterium linens]
MPNTEAVTARKDRRFRRSRRRGGAWPAVSGCTVEIGWVARPGSPLTGRSAAGPLSSRPLRPEPSEGPSSPPSESLPPPAGPPPAGPPPAGPPPAGPLLSELPVSFFGGRMREAHQRMKKNTENPARMMAPAMPSRLSANTPLTRIWRLTVVPSRLSSEFAGAMTSTCGCASRSKVFATVCPVSVLIHQSRSAISASGLSSPGVNRWEAEFGNETSLICSCATPSR